MHLRFVTSNPQKLNEATSILSTHGITVMPVCLKIDELQTTDMKKLVHDKVLQAFERFRRPLFVEHTGLFIGAAGDLPGGLTQIFWDSLDPDRFSRLFGALGKPTKAVIKCAVAYCDGKKIFDFESDVPGQITESPRGLEGFNWDCVFQPDGETLTYAEMRARKNDISMRHAVLCEFAKHVAAEDLA
ncbi:MAG TPA: non-canonical purine NTP pyrophosphatase [Gemmatimonadaceae bacterium]